MQFAEVFLRLGASLVAWMVIYAYVLWLAAARVVGCGPDGSEMHALLLGFAPVAAAMSFALRATRPFDDIQQMLRWLAVPLALLLPLTLLSTWIVFDAVWLQGRSVCTPVPPPGWQQLWVPVQLAALATITYAIALVWRAGIQPAAK